MLTAQRLELAVELGDRWRVSDGDCVDSQRGQVLPPQDVAPVALLKLAQDSRVSVRSDGRAQASVNARELPVM